MTQPIFDSEWAADEELLLIEGLLEKGMGNWKDVSDFVMTKSAVKCEAHYAAVYLNSPTAPLPVRMSYFEISDCFQDMSGNLLNPSIYPKEATNYASYPAQNAPLVQKSELRFPFLAQNFQAKGNSCLLWIVSCIVQNGKSLTMIGTITLKMH